MSGPEQQLKFEANNDDGGDLYKNEDNFVYRESVNFEEGENEGVEVKEEEEDSETDYNALENVNQSANNGK